MRTRTAPRIERPEPIQRNARAIGRERVPGFWRRRERLRSGAYREQWLGAHTEVVDLLRGIRDNTTLAADMLRQFPDDGLPLPGPTLLAGSR